MAGTLDRAGMGLTARIRMAAVVLGGASVALGAPGVAAGGDADVCAGAEALCPNLQTVDPGHGDWLAVERLGRKGHRRVLVRLSNRIGNEGPGPLELTSGAPSDGCLPAGGDPGHYRDAEQRIYRDKAGAGPAGVFERASDTDPPSVVAIGCYRYHAVHNHWHFQDFAEYRLEALGGEVLGAASKVGFCVWDNPGAMAPPPPGTPSAGYYSANGCNGLADPAPEMGLSIGFTDLYSQFTPGQTIRVPGLVRGEYCLVSTANPAGRIREEPLAPNVPGTDDNDREVRVLIRPKREQIEDLGGPC